MDKTRRQDALVGKVLDFGTCGCTVEGAGTLQEPVRIVYCSIHATALFHWSIGTTTITNNKGG